MVLFSLGLVNVGDELREVNGHLITHKRPDEISQILVKTKVLSMRDVDERCVGAVFKTSW